MEKAKAGMEIKLAMLVPQEKGKTYLMHAAGRTTGTMRAPASVIKAWDKKVKAYKKTQAYKDNFMKRAAWTRRQRARGLKGLERVRVLLGK